MEILVDSNVILDKFSIENILMIRFPTEDTERKNHREHRGNNSPYCINSIANWYYRRSVLVFMVCRNNQVLC